MNWRVILNEGLFCVSPLVATEHFFDFLWQCGSCSIEAPLNPEEATTYFATMLEAIASRLEAIATCSLHLRDEANSQEYGAHLFLKQNPTDSSAHWGNDTGITRICMDMLCVCFP